MSRIEWDESTFTVHNEELDRQHRELFEIYNALHESLINDSPELASTARVDTLNKLVDYTMQHFSNEEAFMREIGYPQLESHLHIHQMFKDRVAAMHRDLKEDRIVLSTSLIKVLRNWIIDHIATEDKLYGSYHKKKTD